MSIHVPEELEARLRQRASEQGVTVDELVARELERLFPPRPVRTLRGKGALQGADSAGLRARDLAAYLRGDTESE
ncbi:hypothetical protein OG895_18110 [Streptomyces sp. NBC_00201]|uniref:hypothetical protein n=1 Tax=Streptomyces sp. NBC_00201 TaxID=2975679 RepID=UPI00224CD907|nr:hypothetical protein [Streptomyces sp. NBC_00201]MCX5247117.1 hypothetical protein [Streptomyces sp. NBC_00201]